MKERIITAAIGAPLVLWAVFSASPWPLALIAVVAGAFALREASALHSDSLPLSAALVVATLLISVSAFAYMAKRFEIVVATYMLLALHIGAVTATYVALKHNQRRYYLVSAILYVCLPFIAILNLHQLQRQGPVATGWDWHNALALPLLCIWAADTAAIFVGKYLGRRLLAPSISPKKTWEGAIGNLVAACVTGWFLAPSLRFDSWVGLGVGVTCGILGQLGDLFESWLKRQAGQKDSGALLPGHGGALDRIDSLLFAAIPTLVILATIRNAEP